MDGAEQLRVRDLRDVRLWGRQVYELIGREPGVRGEVTAWGQVVACHEHGPTWDDSDLEYAIDYRDRGGRRGRVICKGSTLTRATG